jgi:hypothetical protein
MQRAIWSFALILLIPTGAQAVYTYTYPGVSDRADASLTA